MQADPLTRALEAGDFEAAERIAIEYGKSVAARIRAGGDIAVLREALDTLNDRLHLARVLRAHLAAQVCANSLAVEYQPAASENRHWQFEA
jgi:hypothetical protein